MTKTKEEGRNKQKILMIDDNADLLEVYEWVLESAGYQIITARDGVEGIKRNEESDPDLILLDLKMIGMDGIEALREIRKKDDKVKVIILTGFGNPDTLQDVADLNVSKYITKSLENKELIQAIRETI